MERCHFGFVSCENFIFNTIFMSKISISSWPTFIHIFFQLNLNLASVMLSSKLSIIPFYVLLNKILCMFPCGSELFIIFHVEGKRIKKISFKRNGLLNYFNIHNMDMKRHTLICFSVSMYMSKRKEWGSY